MFVLKHKYNKLAKKREEDILRIQETFNREEERLMKKITSLEAQIIEAQEKNQQTFYKKERELKDQVQLGIIDHKEFHFSMRLLTDIEKTLK